MLPIRDVNPTRRTPWVTIALIALDVGLFLLWQPTLSGGPIAEERQTVFFYCWGFVPWELTNRTNLADGGRRAVAAIEEGNPQVNGRALQLVLQGRADELFPPGRPERRLEGCPDKSWLLAGLTAMFLHGGWLHIAGNMLFLWIFGNNVEDRLGRGVFVLLYLVGGAAATLLQWLVSPQSAVPNVGASGAIAAILGSYLVLFPRARIYTLVMFFFITFVELPAVVVLTLWFVLQLFSGVGELGTGVNSGVAYWAHVGGFVTGLVLTVLLFRNRRAPGPLPPRPDVWGY